MGIEGVRVCLSTAAIVLICLGSMLGANASASAQDAGGGADRETSERGNGRIEVDPYIEISQVAIAELSPGDDVVTFTQLAAGVDASIKGRRSGGSASLRVEQSIGYDETSRDSTTISGVARGYTTLVPNAVTFEAGGLAASTRVDGSGASTLNPLIGEDAESTVYSLYAGPTVKGNSGDLYGTASYRIGYTRVDSPDFIAVAPGADGVDIFDESVSQSATATIGTKPGEPLPVGLALVAGWNQEDVSNFDQRVRDSYVRGDMQLPVGTDLVLVAGVGYEDVEISSRDAVLDVDGNPVIGNNGRFLTDDSRPRQLAYDVSGLIYDAGIIWRPSSRTSLEAHVGRRYDSTTYYGSFAWAPSSRQSVNVSVYDAVSGFGNRLNTALANLPVEFTAGRNALTGDLSGCVGGSEGGNCLAGVLGSVRSSVFRSRGISASYTIIAGRLNAGVGAGYDRRRFIAAQDTVLGGADGLTDTSYYTSFFLSGQIDAQSSFTTNFYANRLESGFDLAGDVTTLGGSAAYSRSVTRRLSARAAFALDYIDSETAPEDFTAASALVGLRYGF